MKNMSDEKYQRVTISLKPSVLKFLDEERGLIKRSTYFRYILEKQALPILKQRAEIKSTPAYEEDMNEV